MMSRDQRRNWRTTDILIVIKYKVILSQFAKWICGGAKMIAGFEQNFQEYIYM